MFVVGADGWVGGDCGGGGGEYTVFMLSICMPFCLLYFGFCTGVSNKHCLLTFLVYSYYY